MPATMKISRFASFVLLLLLLSPMSAKSLESHESLGHAPVYLPLWFDTEDYVSPEPDTIILPLCQILEKHSIRATFTMIGEKSRDLVMDLARLQCWSLKPAVRNDAAVLRTEKKSSNGK
jgi:hypothetical protein